MRPRGHDARRAELGSRRLSSVGEHDEGCDHEIGRDGIGHDEPWVPFAYSENAAKRMRWRFGVREERVIRDTCDRGEGAIPQALVGEMRVVPDVSETGSREALHRLRLPVGSGRVIFELSEGEPSMVVTRILPRKDASRR